jgi:hypothetical protein
MPVAAPEVGTLLEKLAHSHDCDHRAVDGTRF